MHSPVTLTKNFCLKRRRRIKLRKDKKSCFFFEEPVLIGALLKDLKAFQRNDPKEMFIQNFSYGLAVSCSNF